MRALLLLAALAAPASADSFVEPAATRTLKTAISEAKNLAARPAAKAPFALRVLTYNIQGILPVLNNDPVLEAMALGRFREIAARLRAQRAKGQAPHIVVVQEVFNAWAAKAAKEAGYPFVYEGNGARFGKLVGSGLFILSEYPVFTSQNADYKECTGFDCLANKGAMHARVVIPEAMRSFDLYTTHMNADEPPAKPEDSMKARMAQIKDFAAFVNKTRDRGLPAILAGDFNFKPGNADYFLFQGLLNGKNAAQECENSASCTGDAPGPIWTSSVDHVFHLPGSRASVKPSYIAQAFKEPHEGKPLSDHWGLEARYLFVRP